MSGGILERELGGSLKSVVVLLEDVFNFDQQWRILEEWNSRSSWRSVWPKSP